MNSTKLTEEEFYKRKMHLLFYLAKEQKNPVSKKFLQSRSGVFYILLIAMIFLCLSILLNFGLKIKSINYEKKIFETNEMILLEKERSDRLQLKISELKSPARIISKAESELKMKISKELKILQISKIDLENEVKTNNHYVKNTDIELKNYDNFLGTIYNIKGIVMIISESVLTFFIP
jgi:cell division protein FtsL